MRVMPGIENNRVAAMSPEAVNEAKLFKGVLYFYNLKLEEHLTVTTTEYDSFVEVGKWQQAENETSSADYLCTYFVATLLGYSHLLRSMHWISANENRERRMLLSNGVDEQGKPIPFSVAEAELIVSHINQVMHLISSFNS